MNTRVATDGLTQEVMIETGGVELVGDLNVPPVSGGIVVFAHGSGSGRLSSRNRYVAQQLNDSGLATLLFDLLTREEEVIDQQTRHLRFDIELLSERLTGAVDWVAKYQRTSRLPVGLFGASTGAAAALISAAERAEFVKAVVSRGGRPDLAGTALPKVQAPTLLIVGGRDEQVIDLNERAAALIKAQHRITIVPGATHLFEEPGALEQVARLAIDWFTQWLIDRD